MKLIGLLTEDPRTYFEVLEVLREKGLRFVSLEFGEAIPAHVGVILSTQNEAERIPFDRVVTDNDPDSAVSKALKILAGEVSVRNLLIGVDPGQKPGVAAVGDGTVLMRAVATSPEGVSSIIDKMLGEYPCDNVLVRIGNGDRTNRNRIFNTLWDRGMRLEIVNEHCTTTNSQTPDEDAAVEIAMTPGYRPVKRQTVQPCEGELRNIQRLSRLESDGRLTVSRELAVRVAVGELSLREAVDLQGANGKSSE